MHQLLRFHCSVCEDSEIDRKLEYSEPLDKAEHRPKSDYTAFISDGFVSLPGSSEKIPVKSLRNSGALDTFVLQSILPFPYATDTGNCLQVRVMGPIPLNVPLHKKIILISHLVSGVVQVVSSRAP